MQVQTANNFDKNALEAIADPVLQGALQNLATTFGTRRKAAIATVSDWEGSREAARSIKAEVLGDLDKYLGAFVDNAEAKGAKIHWARDAKEACSIVTSLVKECGAEMVVKSKSMLSEEIHLNAALEAEGIEPVETDLGEWIIQLAGETPSHIVVPAIHKTKAQIADLFADKVGTDREADVDELTAAARRILRRRFAEATVGISGVNFGVAETGSILILENEGNIRLTTSLPKTHIAVMGIEKLLPRFTDLAVFLELLPRSGTGQRLTAYQSIITGTKKEESDEGPDELHIVLVDNGRSKMLAHPVTRQSLACIRCGACLNACPVYRSVGGHAYGAVYPGPIGAIITPQLEGLAKARQLPFASSLCGACREVCPVKIDIPELLLHLRAEITEGTANGAVADDKISRKFGESLAFKIYGSLWKNAGRYRFFQRVARTAQKLIAKDGRIRAVSGIVASAAPPLGAWTAWRDAPVVASESFRELWKRELKHGGGSE